MRFVPLAIVLVAGGATSQTPLYSAPGPLPSPGTPQFGVSLGFALDVVGDLDGDSIADLVAGGPAGAGFAPSKVGLVRVLSGRDGATLFDVPGISPQAFFGASVAGLGDVSGDGIPDFAIAARASLVHRRGFVRVCSGIDGSVLWESGSPAGLAEGFGYAVASAGDADLDGVPDVVVGAREGNRAYLLGGVAGSVMQTIQGPASAQSFGESVDSVRDLDGDGIREILVGAPGTGSNVGAAYVVSGASGAVRLALQGVGSLERFGASVRAVGDLDADGVFDFAVGSPSFGFGSSGIVRAFSGASGALLHLWSHAPLLDTLGTSIAPAGDVNGDGHDDVIAGAHLDFSGPQNGGGVYVFSGLDGSQLYDLHGDLGQRLGASVAGGIDLDLDGRPDLAAGGPDASFHGVSTVGVVRAWRL